MKKYPILLPCFCAMPLFGQSNMGGLRLNVADASGIGVQCSVELVSEANHFRQTFVTDKAGNLVAERLPFGVYQVQVQHTNFAPFSSLEVNLYKSDRLAIRVQGDVENLTDRLNVIDFAGLFSGNAIGPPLSAFIRVEADY